MAKLDLSEKQQKQIQSLISAVGKDAKLRDRLQSDARSVFKEYGLSALLPANVDLEITLARPEGGPVLIARAFAEGAGHWDFTHCDMAGSPEKPGSGIPPIPHIDIPHCDISDNTITAGTRIRVNPINRG
jgi:hypothetical protein